MNLSTPIRISPAVLLFTLFTFTAMQSSFAQAGCTDELACNYDAAAVTDDGSCEYQGYFIPINPGDGPAVQACFAPPGYIFAEQSCVETVVTDDPFCLVTEWDNVCQSLYEACLGCEPTVWIPALAGDGPIVYSCTQPAGYILPNQECALIVASNDLFCFNTIWDEFCQEQYEACVGCSNPVVFIPEVPDSGPAIVGCGFPPAGYVYQTQFCVGIVLEDSPECLGLWSSACQSSYDNICFGCENPGCTDATACNFDPTAGCNDGSCIPTEQYYIPITPNQGPLILACEAPANYILASQDCAAAIAELDPFCLENAWDEICQSEYAQCLQGNLGNGCTYLEALNYQPSAFVDDGSCFFGIINPCPTDIDGNGIVNSGDLAALLGDFGTTCGIVVIQQGQ